MTATRALGEGWTLDETNHWMRYHSQVSSVLTSQRTALSSALIPITAYVLVSGIEAYRRWPDLMREIAAAMLPEEIGRAGHRPGNQVDNVRMWSLANFPNVGRLVLAQGGMLADDDLEKMATVMDFWKRAAGAYRFDDGTYQSWDSGDTCTPYRALVDDIVAQCKPVSDEEREEITRFNALMTSFLFMQWFDTRSGFQDSGPYELPDGRTLLLRGYKDFGNTSHFPWSASIADQFDYTNLLGAFVLNDVSVHVSDFGTTIADPDDYLSQLSAFALFDTGSGALAPVRGDALVTLSTAAKSAQKSLYRMVAGMERKQKIDAGAYVYFTFLRPFAEIAGIADDLDWTVPRDSLDVYEFLSMIDGAPPVSPDTGEADTATYYPPVPSPT